MSKKTNYNWHIYHQICFNISSRSIDSLVFMVFSWINQSVSLVQGYDFTRCCDGRGRAWSISVCVTRTVRSHKPKTEIRQRLYSV